MWWSWLRLRVWSLVTIVLAFAFAFALDQVEGYCEQIVLPANSSTSAFNSRTFNPKRYPGPHVHIFGPSVDPSSNQSQPPQQVTAGQVFVLQKSQLSFEFTCVAGAPVNWRYVGTAVSSPDITFERGRNLDATCFFMTIIFPAAVDEITGQYVCYQETTPEINSNFTLYAGQSGNGYLLFRKAGISIRGSMESQPILQLPCVVNDPNITVTLWDKIRNTDDNWHEISPEFYTFDPLTGVRVNTSALEGPIALYKCESSFSKQDAVYLTYKGPGEAMFLPASDVLVLPGNETSLQLDCYASSPVTFTSPDMATELELKILPQTQTSVSTSMNKTRKGQRFGYKHGVVASLNLTGVPAAERSKLWSISCIRTGAESESEGDDDSSTDAGSDSGAVLHTWQIRFSTENFQPGLVFDLASGTATCFSKSPANLTFYYVLCELITQCQFLQPCLENSQPWACPDNLAKNPRQLASNETSITVQLQDLSGALSCVGVDVDQTIYVHRTATTGKLNLDQNQTDLVAINLIGNWEILLGSLVQVECIASKRFFLNNLTFQLWAGDTMVKLMTQEYLSTEDNSLIAGMFIRRIQFKMMDYKVDQIVCVAPRYDSNTTVSQSVPVKVKKKFGAHGPGSGVNWTAIVLGVCAAVFLIVVVIVMYFWRATKVKAAAAAMNPGLMLSDMEFELLQRFREGSPHHLLKGKGDFDGGPGGEGAGADVDRAGDEYLNIVEDGHYYAQMIPYNTNAHEIALEKITFDLETKGTRQILGIGEYGIVYKGVYDNGTFGVPVAVKELKPNAQYVYLKALLAEIKIMIYVGQHENIVEFLGACTRSKLEACIVLRLYPYGTLERYLRDHRQTLAYQNVTTIRSITNAGSGYVNPTELCVNDLIKWSLQIASALEYLFFKKVIHGDLATRNVLLDETLTAKVSDFGLARQRYTDYDFPKLCDMPLPWRWMSIESLRYLDFTQQSDLWSFGVTMWEIFSLAEIPYMGQRLSSSFLSDLENGIRLERPSNASEEMYGLMRECWITNPKDRITIHDVKRQLEGIVAAAAASGAPSEPINYKQIEFIVTEEE